MRFSRFGEGQRFENMGLDDSRRDGGEHLPGHGVQVSSAAKTVKKNGARDLVRPGGEKRERERLDRA